MAERKPALKSPRAHRTSPSSQSTSERILAKNFLQLWQKEFVVGHGDLHTVQGNEKILGPPDRGVQHAHHRATSAGKRRSGCNCVRRSSTDSSNGSKGQISCVSGAHFHRNDGRTRKANPPLSALGPNVVSIWCQNRAIFPVFFEFAGFFAFCRQ